MTEPEKPPRTFKILTYREAPSMKPERRGEKDVYLTLEVEEREVIPVRMPKEELTDEVLAEIVSAYVTEKEKWEGKEISY